MNHKTLNGHLCAALTITIWGTTFISTKVLLQVFNPLEIMFFRLSLAFLALFIVSPKRLKTKSWKEELYFAGAGLTGITLYFLCENFALQLSTASNVGVLVSVAPLFTALLAGWLLKGEKPGVLFYVGFAVAIIGVILVSFNGRMVLKLNPLGDLLAVTAAVVWAFYSIFLKKIEKFGHSTVLLTRRVFFYGILFMIPAMFVVGFDLNPSRFLNPVNLLNILYLGLGASAFGFVIWSRAMRILGAVKTSVYIYAVPVITVITSALILKERIDKVLIGGIALILAGLVLSELRPAPAKKIVTEFE